MLESLAKNGVSKNQISTKQTYILASQVFLKLYPSCLWEFIWHFLASERMSPKNSGIRPWKTASAICFFLPTLLLDSIGGWNPYRISGCPKNKRRSLGQQDDERTPRFVGSLGDPQSECWQDLCRANNRRIFGRFKRNGLHITRKTGKTKHNDSTKGET